MINKMWNLSYDFKTFVIWLTLLLLKQPFIVIKEYDQRNVNISSSVWCYTSVYGKSTVISGITSKNDFKEISTSWLNHSHFYLKLALVDSIGEYKLITDRTVIMSRFKPDNIMHVIHDDLLPLYVTFKRICFGNVLHCFSNTLILLVDDSYTPFYRLYEAFSSRPIITLKSINTVVCLSHALIGVDSDSIFFQYGYDKPQGPVRPFISGVLLHEFTEYILNYFKIERTLNQWCTLIGRKFNRKILNEKYLMELIKDIHIKKYNQSILVKNVDINSYSIEKVIGSVASSKLLLGMHGAGMILAMFLPPGSKTLEIFPYGIVKEYVSAVYSMSRINGIYFGYLSWMNHKKENSLRHPEYPYLLGGFETISNSVKKRISAATSVSAVYCCHDPLYLHFMYQDTYIDNSVVGIINKSFETHNSSDIVEDIYREWYFPSHVRNISCSYSGTEIMLTWQAPINVKNQSEFMYRIALSCSKFNATYVTKFSSINVKLSLKERFLSVWIQCTVSGIKGTDSHYICDLQKLN